MKSLIKIKSLAAQNQWTELTSPLEKALGWWSQPHFHEQGNRALDDLLLEDIVGEIQSDTLWVLQKKLNWEDLHSLSYLAKISSQVDNEFLFITAGEKFAQVAHQSINHKRKYTGEDYFVHLKEVQELVASIGGTPAMQIAALLHDTVEDVKISLTLIQEAFGEEISQLVEMLTDVSLPSDGNRQIRKQKDLEHTAQASAAAKTIKLADMISNIKSITLHDPNFAKVYMREKRKMLEVLKDGHPVLYQQAQELINDYFKN